MLREKKVFISILIVLCLLNSIMLPGKISFSNVYAADAGNIVNDNFNSLLKNWSIGPNDKSKNMFGEISEDPEDGTNKVLKLTRDPKGNGGVRAEIAFDKPLKGIISFEYRVWFDTEQGTLHHIGEFMNNFSQVCFQFMTYGGQYIVKNGGMSNDRNYSFPNLKVEAKKWHKIKYIIDTENSKYDFYIDDINACKDFDMALDVSMGLKWGRFYQSFRPGNYKQITTGNTRKSVPD